MDKTSKCAICIELKDCMSQCTLCNTIICNDCIKNNNPELYCTICHKMYHTMCTECGQEITCNKNKLCKDCDRHPFDMDIENNGKSMTLEQAFDSILTKNFEEYVKPEEKKPLKKYKK